MLSEGVLPDMCCPLHYQVIFQVSYIFKSLLNPNILQLIICKPYIFSCKRCIAKCCHFLTGVIDMKYWLYIVIWEMSCHCWYRSNYRFVEMFVVKFKGHYSIRTLLVSNPRLILDLIRCRVISGTFFKEKMRLISHPIYIHTDAPHLQ